MTREQLKSEAGAPKRRKRRRWVLLGVVVFVGAALAAARLVLPGYLLSYVNGVLDQSPDYDGRVGDIDVHLWRGAYVIRDVAIVKTTNSVPAPFFECPRIRFSIDWSSLLIGGVRGRVFMQSPRLNFVHGPSPEETQTGINQPWLTMLTDLFPLWIDKAVIVDGEIHFQAFHTRPQVDIYLAEIQGTVRNLTNVESKTELLSATVSATGTAMESGRLEFDMSLDPGSHRPTFNLAARLLDMDVTKLDSLTRAYGDFDFESGKFDFVTELSVKDGFLQGYAKPLFRNVRVLGPRDTETDDPLRVLWEALVGAVGEVFTNQSRDQFGTRISLEGNFDNPRTSVMEIVGNVLYNAFVRAYLPRVEGHVAPDLSGDGKEQRHKKRRPG